MKVLKSLVWASALASAIAFTQCNSNSTEKANGTTTMGLEYKFFNNAPDSTVKMGNLIVFEITVRNHKDSIVGPMRQMTYTVMAPDRTFPLRDGLQLLSKNDSVAFYIPVDSMFLGREAARPEFLPAGTKVAYHVKVTNVYRDKADMIDGQKALLKDLATKSGWGEVKEDESGVLYVISSKKSTKAILPGDSVGIMYKGTLTDGRVFDENTGRDPLYMTVGKSSIIAGWHKGLTHFGEGDEGYLLLNSDLAYDQGFDIIPPYAPLVFKIGVVKNFGPAPK